jgi:hypothetical protein
LYYFQVVGSGRTSIHALYGGVKGQSEKAAGSPLLRAGRAALSRLSSGLVICAN